MIINVELSKKQREIVIADNGPIYVKAGAGSGKTRVLTERVRYLLQHTKKKVLALTFTNKAGEEIRERLSSITDIEKRVFVGTFHSFCQSIIENHGKLIGYSDMPHIFDEESDRLELAEQAIKQTPSYAIKYRSFNSKERKNYQYRLLDYVSRVKRKLIAENDLYRHAEDEDVVLLYRNYQDCLHNQNAIDFDDLILLAYSLLINYPRIAALYRRSFYGICIDEAQDLNNAQYQLILALTNGNFKNVMVVGDPNQSIFHFNGSSPEYMDKQFVQDFNPKVIELKENYRSSLAILKAAEKIIPDAETITGTVKQGVFEINSLEDAEDEADWVVKKIESLVATGKFGDIEGSITHEKIAVLARNKYILSAIEERLSEKKIPFYYKMTPGGLKFESTEMRIFDLALRVRINSLDYLHKKRLEKLLKSENIQSKMLNVVHELHEDGSNIKRVFDRYKEQLVIDDENEKEMIYNDINELLVHWHNYARKTESKSLHYFKNAMALGQTHPKSQHSGITLSTVHTMKGQEFDIVFLIGMDNETFPDYRALRNGGIEMTQEKNNLYVAFTRAKRFLYVSWPRQRKMPWGDYRVRKISQFLKVFDTIPF